MKKTLLLGAGLLTGLTMMAQGGTDITPANYHFNTAKEIPYYNVFLDNVNIKAGSTNVFGEMGFAEFYQDGLWVLTSAGQNDVQQDAFRAAWQLVNMGGEVGQVAFFGGKSSGVKEALNEVAPDMSATWDALKLDEEATAGWQLHLMMNPDNCPTASQGYIHAKIVYNVYSKDCLAGNKVWQNIGISTNANSLMGWEQSASFNFTEDACIKRYEDDNEPELDPEGNAIWDPTKWVVYEFDFTIPDADDTGQVYIPTRLRMNAMNANAWNNYGVFIQDISFSFFEGGSLGEGVNFANPELSTITLTPFGESDTPVEPAPALSEIYLVGNPNGWNINESSYVLKATSENVFEGTFDIAASDETIYFRFYTELGNWGEDAALPSIGCLPNDNTNVEVVFTDDVFTGTCEPGKGSWQLDNWEGGQMSMVVDMNDWTVKFTNLSAGVGTLVDTNAPVEYYNLQGVKVLNPENGLYIRKQGNNTSKVLVR